MLVSINVLYPNRINLLFTEVIATITSYKDIKVLITFKKNNLVIRNTIYIINVAIILAYIRRLIDISIKISLLLGNNFLFKLYSNYNHL